MTLLARGSIRRRLVVQLALVAAVLSLVFFLIVRVVAERAAEDTQDNILLASATAIVDALHTDRGQVTLELPYSAISMLGTITQDRVFYRISVGGETLTGYDDLPESPAPNLPETGSFATFEYRGELVRRVTLLHPVSIGNRPHDVRVSVAQTRLGLAVVSSRITSFATAVAVGFFLVATALSLFAAQSALAPLGRLTGSVTRRGPDDLRPVVADTPAELVPLVGALNQFIGRLKKTLTRSEDLITEAAHRVRTPLAVVRARAEVTHHRLNKPEHRQAIREMIRAIDESARSAGQLLDHAMVSFRTVNLENGTVDIEELVREVCGRLEPTADVKDIRIVREIPPARADRDGGGARDTGDAPGAQMRGDAILLSNALGNILDNAIKYSPPDSQITVAVEATPRLRISVRDQGRGFAGAETGSMTRRFSRGSNVGDIVGSGLGLTIAQDVARAHGGTLEISENPEGEGACVSLIFAPT